MTTDGREQAFDPVRDTKLRDRVAHRLANLAMRLATERYRSFVAGAVLYGLDAAARDAHEGRDLPPPWRSWGESATAEDGAE